MPHLLVVAGHDPSGGAGVDADCEAAEHFGARATPVITADTEQDGRRVFEIRPRDPELWLRDALRVEAVDAIKVGMLPGPEHVRALARLIQAHPGVPVIVDPVLAASDGTEFLDDVGQAVLLDTILPLGVILTPNLPEAALLCRRAGVAGDDLAARVDLARELLARGATAIVLKGGHGSENPVRDLILEASAVPKGEPVWLERPRVDGASIHGSGCRFASALAAVHARGSSIEEAAVGAGAWLSELLNRSIR